MNLGVSQAELRRVIPPIWQANEPLGEWPQTLTMQLLEERYARDDWNFAR